MNRLRSLMADHQTGRLDVAIDGYQSLLKQQPDWYDAAQLLAAAFVQKQAWPQAEQAFEHAFKLRPFDSILLANYLAFCKMTNQNHKANQRVDAALMNNPKEPSLMGHKATICYNEGKFAEAGQFIAAMEQAKHPLNLDLINLKGMIAREQKQFSLAATCFEQAWGQSNQSRPAFLANLALTLDDLGQSKRALEAIKHSLKLDPNNLNSRRNHALIALGAGDAKTALAELGALSKNNPNDVLAQYYYGQELLGYGTPDQLKKGFVLCEKRWQCPFMAKEYTTKILAKQTHPYWNGEQALKGKKITVMSEIGYGDCLQMLRYLPWIKEQGAKIELVLGPHYKALSPILGNQPAIDHLNEFFDETHHRDYVTGLMSLPLAYLRQSGKETPYHPNLRLKLEERNYQFWQQQLAELGIKDKRIRIGVNARGNITHSNDHNRSIAINQLLEAIGNVLPSDAAILLLQKDQLDNELDQLPNDPRLVVLGDKIKDFSDSTAIMRELDILITIDSAPAHLAGILGIPTWLLLPRRTDWRWGYMDQEACQNPDQWERTHRTPWYPSMRLFRQFEAELGWSPVLTNLQQALAAAVSVR